MTRGSFGNKERNNGMKNKVMYLLAAFTIPAMIIFFLCIANRIIFNGDNSILFSDLSNIYADHLMGIKHLILERRSLIYNWNIGGGINYIPYVLGNLNLTNIPVFITSDSVFQEMILLTQIFRIGLAGVSCYVYLAEHYEDRKLKMLAFSSGYAVSGYSVCFIQTIAWYEAIILLPILVLLAEKLVEDRKILHVKFVFVLVYTFFSSYYLGYMISLFLFLYTIAYAYKSGKRILNSVIRIGLNGVIAAGISAVFLLPAFDTILDSGEVADLHFAVKFGVEDILSQFFLGSFDTYKPDGRPLLYCGIYTALFVVSYIISDTHDKKNKITDFILLPSMLAFLVILPLYYVWHMFDNPSWFEGRFTYIIIFFVVTMAYGASENILVYKRRNIVISAFLLCETLFFCSRIFPDIDKCTLAINYALIIIYSVLCIVFSAKSKIITRFLPVLMCVELLLNAVLCSKAMFAATACESYSYYNEFYETNKSAVAYIEQNDAELYRIEKDYYRRENDLGAAGGKALSSFGTFYNVDFMSMLRTMGITGGQAGRYIGGTPVTDLLLSVRYLISDNTYDPFYESVGVINDKTIYKNSHETGMGMLINQEIENISADQFTNPLEFQNAIVRTWGNANDTVFYPIECYEMKLVNLSEEKTENDGVKVFRKKNNTDEAYIDITVKKHEKECLYAYIPDYAGQVILKLNGMYINSFMGQKNKVINLEKDTFGSDYVTVRIETSDEILSIPSHCIYAMNIEALDKWASGIRYASLEKYDETSITLHAKCDEEKTLMLSLPFDKDWNIYINGEKQKSFQVFQGLTGVKVEEGDYEIQVIFKPGGAKTGAVISFISVIVLLTLFRYETKKSGC